MGFQAIRFPGESGGANTSLPCNVTQANPARNLVFGAFQLDSTGRLRAFSAYRVLL
jgi:hypothetical protein